MIGIDTNILLRIFITEGGSDEGKELAGSWLARAGKGSFYVPIVVLVELVWTLCTRYRYRGPEISRVLTHASRQRPVRGCRDSLVRSRRRCRF